MIDTHIHLDDEAYAEDLPHVIDRARKAGVHHMLVPAIDLKSSLNICALCRDYPDTLFPMIGLHPEEVKDDFELQLEEIQKVLRARHPFIAIGEIGLDFYWTRDNEKQQLEAFERQILMAIEHDLPLMIHCRKAQNEMVPIIRQYHERLKGGVFHCFTGNLMEAEQLLAFDRFVLGIGGVLTFKNAKLPEVVSRIPLDRIVLETDGPYMAPVPHRGKRNESAFLPHIVSKIAESQSKTNEEVITQTTANAIRLFGLPV